jgi:hypothetical protein
MRERSGLPQALPEKLPALAGRVVTRPPFRSTNATLSQEMR